MAINLEKKKGTQDGVPSWDMVEAMLKDAKANALEAFERSARNYCGHGLERFSHYEADVIDENWFRWTATGVREDAGGSCVLVVREAGYEDGGEVELPAEAVCAECLAYVGRHMDAEVEALKRAAVDDLKEMLERRSRRGTTVGDFVDRHFHGNE